MKKIFQLNETHKKVERQVDSIKHEINKYIARERRKELPEKVDFWDFACRIGKTQDEAEKIHLTEMKTSIDRLVAAGNLSFYVEVLTKPGVRQKKKTQ